MSIKPPMCKQCGHAHYGLEHVYEGRQPTHPLASMSMFETIKTVRKERNPVPSDVAPSKLAAAQAEIEALQAEVAMLKRKLAEKAVTKTPVTKNNSVTDNVTVTKKRANNVTPNRRGRPPVGDKALTKAERTRKWRASKR